ncbi:MAG: hypothetical protein VW524_04435 [Halieaceae bacterium]
MESNGVFSNAVRWLCVAIVFGAGSAHANAATNQALLAERPGLEHQELIVESFGLSSQAPLLQLAQAGEESGSEASGIADTSVLWTDSDEGQVANDVDVPPDGQTASQPEDEEETWLDSGHGYVTEKADDLTRWFDSYFGSTEADQNVASSRLRVRVTAEEDEREGTNFRVSLGGKVNLPQISKRLDLVFRGDDPADDINGREDLSQSPVALQLQVGKREETRHRFDLTLGVGSGGPKPGARYRYAIDFNDRNSLQFTERVQYEFDDGVISTSRLVLDHQLADDALLRSYSRVLWGEATDGVEASSSLQWIKFWQRRPPTARGTDERGLMVYGEVSGQTDPYEYVSNYRVGFRYRRQTYRRYLFLEFEPSYNWRVDEPYDERAGAWRVELRFEFLLFDDLRRDKG